MPKSVESDSDVFEILSVLGHGGMGIVYKAKQAKLDRIVAIKMLRPGLYSDTELVQKLIKEAKATALLEHENIVKVYSLSKSVQNQLFIAMEYVQCRTLAEILADAGKLSEDQFYAIFKQVLEALSAAHSAGVVHRDIKPSNILVTAGGAVKLADFGIAKLLSTAGEQAATQTGVLLGTPWYMSPEQCAGKKVDARSDLYSVGCVMHEALSGSRLYDGASSFEVLFKHLNDPPVISQTINPCLRGFIWRLLEKDPDERYASAADVLKVLDDCRRGISPQFEQTPTRRSASAPVLRKLPLLLTLAVLLFAGSYLILKRPDGSDNMPKTLPQAYPTGKKALAKNEEANLLASENPDQAIKLRAEAAKELDIAIESAMQENNTKELIDAYIARGNVAAQMDKQSARIFFDKAIKTANLKFGKGSRPSLRAIRGLAEYYRDLPDYVRAADAYRTALDWATGEPRDTLIAHLEQGLAVSLLFQRLPKDALPHAKAAYDFMQQNGLEKTMDGVTTGGTYAQCLIELGRPEESEPYLSTCAETFALSGKMQNFARAYLIYSAKLARAYSSVGKRKQAMQAAERAIEYLDLTKQMDKVFSVPPEENEMRKLLAQLKSNQ